MKTFKNEFSKCIIKNLKYHSQVTFDFCLGYHKNEKIFFLTLKKIKKLKTLKKHKRTKILILFY